MSRVEFVIRPVTSSLANKHIALAGVANIGETIREAILRWLGHVERKTDEDVVMRT